MWVCARCQSRHDVDRMFCPKCGAPAPPKTTGAPQNRPPAGAQPRPPQTPNRPEPQAPGPRVSAPQSGNVRRPVQSDERKQVFVDDVVSFVDDVAPPRKRKTDPLVMAQKQVLRAAEQFKEVETSIEDPDEHLTWDSASALERSIDKVNKNREKKNARLYGETASIPGASPTRASASAGAIDELDQIDRDLFVITPNLRKIIYGGLLAIVAVVGFWFGQAADQSAGVSSDDTSEHINFFTGKVTVSKLNGLWLGTDTVGGAQQNVEYLFNDPGSLTVLSLSPTGQVTGAQQSTYTFSSQNLATTAIGASSTSGIAAAPPAAGVTGGTNMIVLKAPDRSVVLHRPTGVIGTWIMDGTQGNTYRYIFNANGTAVVPNPTASASPAPVNCNYSLAGDVMTLTQHGAVPPLEKWMIAFNGADLILTSTDSTGTINAIHLHPSS